MARIEAAEAHIVPKFGRVYSALEQTLIETKSNFRLICVKVVRGDASNRLDTIILIRQYLLVHEERFAWVVEQIIDAGDASKHAWLMQMFFLPR